MKISVWDTYVKKEGGSIMHFDILVPSEVKDTKIVFDYGMQYLKSKSLKTNILSASECRLCHIEQATEKMISTIAKNGFDIIEMKNCN